MTIRNGAFPHFLPNSRVPLFDGLFPVYTINPAGVDSAAAVDERTVRVVFGGEVRHSSSSNPDDALNPANYDFTGEVEIDAASVSLVQASPTIVDIALDSEMTQGEDYTVEVSNVLTPGGEELFQMSAPFVGFGESPQVETAWSTGPRKVKLRFNEAMLYDAALTEPSNYSFDGPTALTAVSPISAENVDGKTVVEVPFTGEVEDGEEYDLEVSEVRDIAENLINPEFDTGTFTGANPELLSAVALTQFTVRGTFNCEMTHLDPEGEGDALNPASYTILGPNSLTVTEVELTQAIPTIVTLTLSGEMRLGGAYTLQSSAESVDGYVLQDSEADFTGFGVEPQVTGAECFDPSFVRISFDNLMKHDSALEDPENYVFAEPLPITANRVRATDAGGFTFVDVSWMGTPAYRVLYSVEVSGVSDAAGNPLDTDHDTAEFNILPPPDVKKFSLSQTELPIGAIGSVQAAGVRVEEERREEDE